MEREIKNPFIHELKTNIEYFKQTFFGHKDWEIRRNDRDFKLGDVLILKEWNEDKKEFTGREIGRTISFIFNGGKYGLEDDYVIMSIQ